ncbi:hypothetical protein [Pseudorhodoplanes sp.]|uniref:hypothetical protein n=1 Tax=Pseudorhodoplanes sp. TaxID=1934341 RepID=UPI003D0E0DB7
MKKRIQRPCVGHFPERGKAPTNSMDILQENADRKMRLFFGEIDARAENLANRFRKQSLFRKKMLSFD